MRTPQSGFAYLGTGKQSVAEHTFRMLNMLFSLHTPPRVPFRKVVRYRFRDIRCISNSESKTEPCPKSDQFEGYNLPYPAKQSDMRQQRL